MKKLIISEQATTESCGNPTTETQATGLGYTTTVPPDFSLSVHCFKIINGKSFYKRKDGQPIVSQQTVGGVNYSGFYKASKDFIGVFEISMEDNKLYAKFKFGKTELTKKTETKFSGKILGVTYDVEFTITNKEATGGKITHSIGGIITEATFTRTTAAPEPIEEITWENVTKATWEALKKAGYAVKEYAGKFWAAVKDELHVKENELNTWDCIDNYLQGQGFFKLMSGTDGKNFYRYTATDFVHNKKYTNLFFYRDGQVEYKYRDSGTTVPGYKGKWSCGDNENSFQITWDNGEKDTYGGFFQAGKTNEVGQSQQDGGQGQTLNDTTGAPKIKSFSQVCSAVLPCPKIDDVKQGKKLYKVCMKCPEIQQFQEVSPLFKQIYFDLLKENGKKQMTDQYFGPIMQAAIRNFQETIDKDKFLDEWGMIGKNTIDYLSKQPDKPQKPQTSQPPTQTPTKYELTQDKIVTTQTKF